MIFKDSLGAIIEAIYLGEHISTIVGKCNIRVNPTFNRYELEYTSGKTIILNMPGVEERTINILKDRNTIISRIEGYNSSIPVRPYIMRVNNKIRWNGETIDCPHGLDWFRDVQEFSTSENQPLELYFPKFNNPDNIRDSNNNLTALGWALHQVGQNLIDSPFFDLDLIKTDKLV